MISLSTPGLFADVCCTSYDEVYVCSHQSLFLLCFLAKIAVKVAVRLLKPRERREVSRALTEGLSLEEALLTC